MKKIVSSLIVGLMAVSLVMMGCSNDSSSDNSALMLLAGGGAGSGSGGSGGTVAAGGAVKALADAKDGDTVDLSEYRFSDKIALTVDKEITVKNAKLNGGFITVSEAATLDNVDGGTIVLVGDGKDATLKDCDAKNVIVKGSELSRGVSGFTLKLNGGVIENIVNSYGYLTIETAKVSIKKLLTNKILVINSTEDSKIDIAVTLGDGSLALGGNLGIEALVTTKKVGVASNAVNIKKTAAEIVAMNPDNGFIDVDEDLDIEAIKAAVGELTASEGEAIRNAVTALQKEAEEMESKFQAAEEETKKALEEYEKEQAAKAVVTVYVVAEGQVSPANKVPLAEMEEFLKAMTAEMPEGVEIEFFADKNCTTVIDVKALKAGDSVYIKVPVVVPEHEHVYIFTNNESHEVSNNSYTFTATANEQIFYFSSTNDDTSENNKLPIWDLGLNLGYSGPDVIVAKNLIPGKTYTLKLSVSTQSSNTDGKAKHVDIEGEQFNVISIEKKSLTELLAMKEDLENGTKFYITGEICEGIEEMAQNVYLFRYSKDMKGWGTTEVGFLLIAMSRDNGSDTWWKDENKISVWDKGNNIEWQGSNIQLQNLTDGKEYCLVMTNSTNPDNTDGKGKHLEIFEAIDN